MLKLTESEKFILEVYKSESSLILNEKVYDIKNEDLSLIIPYFDSFFLYLDSIMTINDLDIALNKELGIIDSSVFISDDCITANKLNPIKINIYGIFQPRYAMNKGSFWIDMGLPPFMYTIFNEWKKIFTITKGEKFTFILDYILRDRLGYPLHDCAYVKNFFTEMGLKQTFAHELGHWIRDSLTMSIQKMGKQTSTKGISPNQYYKVPDLIFSDMEMDAYIHGINVTKKMLGEIKWNSLTINDLFSIYPALKAVEKNANTRAIDLFKKKLYLRLNREGMLGANMRGENGIYRNAIINPK